MKYKIFTLLLFTFYFLLFTSHPVGAQNISLGITPPTFQIMIQPGKSITQVYKVTNFKDPVILTSRIAPFTPLDDSGGIKIIDCARVEVIGCESMGWFSFQNTDLRLGQSFFVKADYTQEIVLRLSVPEYASEGDYYNVLLMSSQAPPSLGASQARITSSIASLILITVSKDGTPTKNIKITQLAAQKLYNLFDLFKFRLNLFDTFSSIPVELKVTNSGSAYTKVKGSLKLTGFPGLTTSFAVPEQTVLAGHTKKLLATPSALIANNQDNPSLILPKGIYLGKYSISAFVENEDGQNDKQTTHFYALPLSLGALVLLTLTIIVASVNLYRKIRPKL